MCHPNVTVRQILGARMAVMPIYYDSLEGCSRPKCFMQIVIPSPFLELVAEEMLKTWIFESQEDPVSLEGS